MDYRALHEAMNQQQQQQQHQQQHQHQHQPPHHPYPPRDMHLHANMHQNQHDMNSVPHMGNQPHMGDMAQFEQYMHGHFGAHQHMPHAGPAPTLSQTNEITRLNHVIADRRNHAPVTSLAFDNQEELLWAGTQMGHASSYHSMAMQRYTAFQVHMTNDIRQILPCELAVLFLTKDQLGCYNRTGRSSYTVVDPEMTDMQCMLLTTPTSLLTGGHQNSIFQIDLTAGKPTNKAMVDDAGCAILRSSQRFICSGDTGGKVSLLDPLTLNREHVLDAHSGTLSDIDVNGNLLVTCGFSNRQGTMLVDRFIKVYDLRVMRAVAPLQTTIDAMFLRFVSDYGDKLAVVSQSGQFLIMNTATESNSSLFPYSVSQEATPILSFDVASSYQTMAFGDMAGHVHLFAHDDSNHFNQFSHPSTFADPVQQLPPMNIDDVMTPYSIIPMQYPNDGGKLLSYWPDYNCQRMYRKTEPVDPELLRSVKYTQNVGYAPNPAMAQRNPAPYVNLEQPVPGAGPSRPVPGAHMAPRVRHRGEQQAAVVPKRYRKVEIKYSKLGVDDFDFKHYNKTNFAGLEIHIPNAYCNAMLQVLYFIEPLRVCMLNHLCKKEFCLSCELGFLFHMLDLQVGQTCQASNFLRAFRTIPEASALELILGDADEVGSKIDYKRLIQSWNRFVLQQVQGELGKKKLEDESPAEPGPDHAENSKEQNACNSAAPASSSEPTVTESLFCTTIDNTFQCRCDTTQARSSEVMTFNLNYPEAMQGGEYVKYTFSDVLQKSICEQQATQAWCNQCNKYQPHVQSKRLRNLPDVLAINCQINSEKDKEFWKIQQEILMNTPTEPDFEKLAALAATVKPCRYGASCTRRDCKFWHENDGNVPRQKDPEYAYDTEPLYNAWLPYGVRVALRPDGALHITDRPEKLDDDVKDSSNDVVYYDLFAAVGFVENQKDGGNLFSCVHVGETYHQRKEGVTCSQWYLFNDFAITPIEKYEAVHYGQMDWKVPCVLYFTKSRLNKGYDLKAKPTISSAVMLEYASLVNNQEKHVTFNPLSSDELPKSGDVIGLDAEFVSLNQEEAEIKSDGTKSTIKPSQMTVARISCVRGPSGDKPGEPFLDDYISTQEQVVDYLTQFSGIKPGDLDVSISSKHLTTLKSTYIKLRYLVDAGVVFVGHGLKKDFRVINIVVPKNQVIDTVDLFYMARQRKISLKFLAWYFLKTDIQSAEHDSIEDARTALKLYNKYKMLKSQGLDVWSKELEALYERGRELSWKIPGTS